jgi:hypothetical protein
MPDGVVFSMSEQRSGIPFAAPVLNDAGQIAFHGVVEGPGVDATNNRGNWRGNRHLAPPGASRLPARPALIRVLPGANRSFPASARPASRRCILHHVSRPIAPILPPR